MSAKFTIYGASYTVNERCGREMAFRKPRCGKEMPAHGPVIYGVCGRPEGHTGYCIRADTLPAEAEIRYCVLREGHPGHCTSAEAEARKREARKAKLPPKRRARPLEPGNNFSRGDLDRLKVWIGCQNPGGCPVGLHRYPVHGMGTERRPEWFDWDHPDPALKVRRNKANTGSRLSGGHRFSFELVTEVLETEAVRVLCKLCHATVTKEQQDNPDSKWAVLREKPGGYVNEIDWNENRLYRARERARNKPNYMEGLPQRPGWGNNGGDRF